MTAIDKPVIAVNKFIRKQGNVLLENRWNALFHASFLAVLPYTSWLSVVIIALITLRKGLREGMWLLFPVIAIHCIAVFTVGVKESDAPIFLVVINSLLMFVPCFVAAYVLRVTASWQMVAWIFLIQVAAVVCLVQCLAPEFIIGQFMHLQAELRELQIDNAMLSLIQGGSGSNQHLLASYFLGLQAVSVIFSACLPLMLARWIQSQLFYPGGFKQEMQLFRADKISLLCFVVLLIAIRQHSVLAISITPTLIAYFLLAGISLAFHVVARKRPLGSLVLLLATLVLLPFIMLPVYVIFGSLDSIFNFRLYLPSKAGKPI